MDQTRAKTPVNTGHSTGVTEPAEKLKYTKNKYYHTNDFRKLHQNPYFIFMYSNTIYILNNTIIECFDIAFNETKKETHLLVLFDFTKEERTATFPKRVNEEEII